MNRHPGDDTGDVYLLHVEPPTTTRVGRVMSSARLALHRRKYGSALIAAAVGVGVELTD
jgi:hypothetical protein